MQQKCFYILRFFLQILINTKTGQIALFSHYYFLLRRNVNFQQKYKHKVPLFEGFCKKLNRILMIFQQCLLLLI